MVKSILVLGKREAQIIKRMDVVGKLPVSKIAAITGRHKKTIYTVLAGKSAFAKRGPKEKLGEKEHGQESRDEGRWEARHKDEGTS